MNAAHIPSSLTNLSERGSEKRATERVSLSGKVFSQTSAEDARREAVRLLRDLGVENAQHVLSVGLLAMARRCADAYQAREDVGPGWLARVAMNGGPWVERPAGAVTVAELHREIAMTGAELAS